jgi:hypothetical protein
MTEEMVGGQHRTDESDADPSVRGEHTNATINRGSLEKPADGCLLKRPTPKEKALATADLVRETALIVQVEGIRRKLP